MQATRSRHSSCRRLRPTSPGYGNSIRRRALTSRRVSVTHATIAWTPAVSLYWRAEMGDTTVIEKLARLRGTGDAYHDYRGELRHFSLETKKGLLRAMGCPVDEPAALALELSQLEAARWRKFLPQVAAARASASISMSPRANSDPRWCGRCASRTAHGARGRPRRPIARRSGEAKSRGPGSHAGALSCRSICLRAITSWRRK